MTKKNKSKDIRHVHANGGRMANGTSAKSKDASSSTSSCWDNKSIILLSLLTLSLSVAHRYHIAFMFESDRHFSHLSSLEREMTFRTEMGLYYSYFKTIIEAPTFSNGLDKIMNDQVTEYPSVINTLKRFNLYPEIILGAAYRVYDSVAQSQKWETKTCWRTDRGKDMEPILSCEGMGDPFYFYINSVFALYGAVAGLLFLFGSLLSDSIFGGLLSVVAFFANHGEATRVQWTPPLRESFGYPVFLLELLVVTYIVKYRKQGAGWSMLVGCLTVVFMLFWQFAQFPLSTQVGSLFVTYMLDYIDSRTLKTILYGHFYGFFVGFILLFGNQMLLTSLFFSSVITALFLCTVENLIYKLKLRIIIWLVQIVVFAAGCLGLKFLIGQLLEIQDDAHVFNLLKSKFSNYSDFHTRLYSCAVEFDYMAEETPYKLSYTILLPTAIVGALLICFLILKQEYRFLLFRPVPTLKLYSEHVYTLVQSIAFTAMAVIIMRLKLFWTPHLCILTSVLACQTVLRSVFGANMRRLYVAALCGCVMAGMSYKGYANLKHQWSIMGEYSNPTQEHLLGWINHKTSTDAVFAGTMPTMANVKLSTGRPIVNHPHYEDAALRERTIKVYSVFSRKPLDEVYEMLKMLKINYYVFEYGWCGKGGKPGCTMPELYDLHDVKNRGRTPVCDLLHKGPNYGKFELVMENPVYKVFKIQ